MSYTTRGEWEPLFGDDLSKLSYKEGSWEIKHGMLSAHEDQVLWALGDYEDFELSFEFMNEKGTNSGIIVYCTDKDNWIPNSVEIQIADDHSEKWGGARADWQCGAIFGRLAAKKSMVRKPGEWNRFTITCEGPFIDVVLNGEHVTAMDMRKWTSATKNPDGSDKPGWLNKPLSKHPTRGKIGLQGKHAGAPIWFRNIRIKGL